MLGCWSSGVFPGPEADELEFTGLKPITAVYVTCSAFD